MLKDKVIYLSEEEQEYLKKVIKTGEHSSREIIRARVLSMLDRTGKKDHVRYKRVAEYTGITPQAVYNMRDEFLANRDIDSYLHRKKRETPPVPSKVDGKLEAEIVALACSTPPKGYCKWTLRMLAEKTVELQYVDEISHTTIGKILKKRNISLI